MRLLDLWAHVPAIALVLSIRTKLWKCDIVTFLFATLDVCKPSGSLSLGTKNALCCLAIPWHDAAFEAV